jgi:hypothetical protein
MKLDFNKKLLIVTQMNPELEIGGATVVMKNLLSAFKDESFHLCYFNYFKILHKKTKSPKYYQRVLGNYNISHIFDFFNKKIKTKVEIDIVVDLIKKYKIDVVVGIFPSLKSLNVSFQASKITGAKFIPYLHDLPYEALSHQDYSEEVRFLEDEILKLSYKILTMSQGMSDFFLENHKIKTFPLEHSYPEKIEKVNYDKRDNIVFWGGSVQSFNNECFKRILHATDELKIDFEITSLQSKKFKQYNRLTTNFYETRSEYISAIKTKNILILAIDWADEANLGKHELKTIFPTRAIEYFASGSKILVHCPENYFLSKFTKKHKCGLVISSRKHEDLVNGIKYLSTDSYATKELQKNASKIASYFSIARISNLFKSYIDF